MRCLTCKHRQTKLSIVTVTLERNELIVIIKKVPAEVCDNCGEYYLSNDITAQVLQRAEIAIAHNSK